MALVYDPTAPAHYRNRDRSRPLNDLRGKTIGFIDNAKPNFHFLVDDLAELLVANYGVERVVKRAKRGASMPAPEGYITDLVKECDLVITGSGD